MVTLQVSPHLAQEIWQVATTQGVSVETWLTQTMRQQQILVKQATRQPLVPRELSELDKMLHLLLKVGLSQPRYLSQPMSPNPVSWAERRELANLLGQVPGKPLSEIVIEERGTW